MSEPNGETTEPKNSQSDTEAMLKALPQELQDSIASFHYNLIRSIVAQQTTMQGDEPAVKVTPDRTDFYTKRMTEVLESGFLNPHVNPPVEIKAK